MPVPQLTICICAHNVQTMRAIRTRTAFNVVYPSYYFLFCYFFKKKGKIILSYPLHTPPFMQAINLESRSRGSTKGLQSLRKKITTWRSPSTRRLMWTGRKQILCTRCWKKSFLGCWALPLSNGTLPNSSAAVMVCLLSGTARLFLRARFRRISNGC